jgi:(R,R)-butanediol dehydrogenase/meso-butanediol dehydrogenase/diacetyl reductase
MLPDSLDWVEGALIEPMAVGLHAAKMASALNGKSILVIGAGPVGLAVTYWARFMGGYNIVVSEPEALRNKSAMDYGATATIDPKAVEDVGAEFAKITGGAPDVIFECVGIPAGHCRLLLSRGFLCSRSSNGQGISGPLCSVIPQGRF